MAQDYIVVQGQLAASATQLGSTVPAGKEYLITKFTLTNTSASDVAVSIWIAADGASAGDANRIFVARTITASNTVSLNVSAHALPPGAKVYASAATGSVVNAYVTYFSKLIAGF